MIELHQRRCPDSIGLRSITSRSR